MPSSVQFHLQSLRTLLRFNCQFLDRLTEDFDEETLDLPIVPGSNSPRWIFLHLAVGLDFALLAIGRQTLLPRPWLTQYGPGSSGDVAHPAPATVKILTQIFSAAAVMDAALANLELICSVDESAVAGRLARPHSAKALQGTALVTIGDTLSHLLTTHFALHLGQLSLARRKAGMPAII